jgi:thiol peroxidase
MIKRPNAVKFKEMNLTLVGPQLKAGDAAPEFCCSMGLADLVTLAKTGAKARLFSVVPSLDTPVCSLQTKKFEEAIGAMKDKVAAYTISLDLPFAQGRFCTAEKITSMKTLSDTHDHSFGQNYGVLIEGLNFPLLTRAVFVVDKAGKITYCEYCAAVPDHPNYEKAIEALKAVAG